MGKKYIKCPRCELNYILEGEDYCHVCKSEMKHHTEADEDDLLNLEDMELCPVCGVNYMKEDQTICDECRGKSKGDDLDEKSWKNDDEDSSVSASSDIDSDDEDEEFNSGFSDIDPEEDDLDPYKTDDDDDLLDDSPIEFALDEEEMEEDIVSETLKDDFETVEVSDDDDDDDEDENDDYDLGDDDFLSKKK